MKIKKPIILILFALTICFQSCKVYNAAAPPERIIKQEIEQPISKINVPILVTTQSIRKVVLDSLLRKNPILNETKTFPVPVFNPITTPTRYIDRILVDKVCEVSRRVNLPFWACALWAPACFKMVVDHVACPFYQEIERWVDETIMSKINIDAPVGYKLNILDINIDGNGNDFTLHVKFEYQVDVKLSPLNIKIGVASCGVGEAMPVAELSLHAKIQFDNNGSISFSNKSWDINYISNCNLTALDIAAQDIYSKFGLQEKFNKLIEDNVLNKAFPDKGLEFKDKIYSAWPKLSKPIKIGVNDTTNVYLKLNVTKISTQDIFLAADSLHALFGVECKPLIAYDQIPDDTPSPLPVITNQPLPDGFNINLAGSIKLKDINKAVADTLKAHKEELKIAFLKIKSIKFYQSGDKLVAKVKIRKPVCGKIYLSGVPKFDYDKNVVSFTDFDFTTETHTIIDPLVDLAKHFEVVKDFIDNKTRYNYGTDLRNEVDKWKNYRYSLSSNIIIIGSLSQIKPLNLVISNNALNPVINVGGQMRLAIK